MPIEPATTLSGRVALSGDGVEGDIADKVERLLAVVVETLEATGEVLEVAVVGFTAHSLVL